MLRAYDVVNQQLLRRVPHNAGQSMDDQQNGGVPYLNCIGVKKYGPRCRHDHVHELSALDDFPAIVSIGERTEVNRKQKKRRPVTDICKTGQYRRVKLLE